MRGTHGRAGARSEQIDDDLEHASSGRGLAPRLRDELRSLVRFNDTLGWRERVRSIDFYRCAEYPLAATLLGPQADDLFLDWGGGDGPFGAWVSASTGAEVLTVDPHWGRQRWQSNTASRVGAALQPILARGEELPFASGAMACACAVSALEHVPSRGDTDCIRELARVLAPGGRLVLTLPIGDRLQECESTPAVPYFERRYDDEALRERLIQPSGLLEVGRLYLSEREGLAGRWGSWWYRLPFTLRLPLRRLVPRVAMRRLSWARRRPAGAEAVCLLLERATS